MANPVNNNSDDQNWEQSVQDYINSMQQQLAETQALLDALVADQQSKKGLEEQAAMYANLERCDADFQKELNQVEKKIGQIDTKIQADEAALEKIDPNISGTIDSLNQLIEKASALAGKGLMMDDVDKAIKQINQIILQFCQVIQEKIQADLAREGMEEFGGNPNDVAGMLQFASMALQAEFNEQSSLSDIQDEAIQDTIDWQNEKSQAEADLKTSHWYTDAFGGGPDKEKDHAIIRAADAMTGILTLVEKSITPLMMVDPGMQEFQIELDKLKEKVQQFLSGHGTLQELKDAMIAALSILVGIIAETAKDTSLFDKTMNKGAQAVVQMKMADAAAEEEVILDAQKYAAVMGGLLKAVQYVGMAIVLALNPTAAMALMVVLDTVLTATGVMDKLQNAIASKLGSTAGAVLTGLVEAGGTAGGAAAIEGIISKVVIQAAIRASEKAVAETVASAIADTVQAATKAAGGVGEKEAESVVSKAVKLAVETAQKKVADVFLSKSIPQLISALVKGNLKTVMEVAQKEAATATAQCVVGLAETAAKEGASVIGQVEIEMVATKFTSQAVADAMEITEKSAIKAGTSSAVRQFMTRAAWTDMASAARTGLFTDGLTGIVALGSKKHSKGEEMQIISQIINTILGLIATLESSGSVSEMLQSSGFLSKFIVGAQVIDNTAGAVGSAGEAEADFEQAKAVQPIAKDHAETDLMQFTLAQLRKDGQAERNQYNERMMSEGEANLKLSKNFNRAEEAIAQALSVSAV